MKDGPDSTRSWILAVACCLNHFIAFGLNRVDGVIFTAFLKNKPEENREDLSWPFTLSGAAVIFAAPLTGFLTTRFSVRIICVVGTLVYSASCMACYFSTNVIFLSAFYGVIRGTGMAMVTTPLQGLIGNNFKRHRGIAMGISSVGTPIGGLVLPLVIQYYLDQYGLRINFLIIAGIALTAILGSVLLVENKPKKSEDQGVTNVTVQLKEEVLEPGIKEEIQMETLGEESGTRKGQDVMILNPKHLIINQYYSKLAYICEREPCQLLKFTQKFDQENKINKFTTSDYVSNEESESNNNISNIKIDGLGHSSGNETFQIPKEETEFSPQKTITKKLKSIFTSRGFYLVALTNLSLVFLISNYGLIIVDYAEDKGIGRRKGVLLITLNAVGDILGRGGFGWVTDRKYITQCTFLIFTLLMTAGLVLSIVFVKDFAILMTLSVVLGVSHGCVTNSSSVIIMEYMRNDEVHLAVSFIRSIVGLSYLPRAPLIGVFRDKLKSYDFLFVTISGLLLLTSLAWLMEKIYLKIRGGRKLSVGNQN